MIPNFRLRCWRAQNWCPTFNRLRRILGDSLSDRIDDADAKLLITADGGYRRGEPFLLKETMTLVAATSTIENVVVVQRTGQDVEWNQTTDHWYHELMESASPDCPPEHLNSEDLLYLLYTSGTTVAQRDHAHHRWIPNSSHATHKYILIYKPIPTCTCAIDIGWVTGHSYIVYGPLANGATSVMYRGP